MPRGDPVVPFPGVLQSLSDASSIAPLESRIRVATLGDVVEEIVGYTATKQSVTAIDLAFATRFAYLTDVLRDSVSLAEDWEVTEQYPSSFAIANAIDLLMYEDRLEIEMTGGGASEMDDLTDADTTTTAPTKNDALKWNGTNWVPAVYDYTFEFTIASFDHGEATIQLIGDGVWQADETLAFTGSYNNGPPTTADVMMRIDGGSFNKVGEMTAPTYLAGTNTEGDINYPVANGNWAQFRLDADDGSDFDVEALTVIFFYNHIRWGVATKNSGFTEADVEGLSSSAISNDQTRTESISSGSGQYLVFAFPSIYTSILDGADYETDGHTGFLFDSIACAFKAPETVSITNSAGYVEDYKVYASELANLGSHTLVTSTGNASINPLYYGKTTKTDTYTEADVEGLSTSEITNDNTQVWDAVVTGATEYMLFAFPKRLGIPTFWVGGFEGGFEAPETVSVTNANGWTEDYYVWRSENSDLGSTVVETK